MPGSKQRYISTSFWDDPWVQTLDPSEKFLGAVEELTAGIR